MQPVRSQRFFSAAYQLAQTTRVECHSCLLRTHLSELEILLELPRTENPPEIIFRQRCATTGPAAVTSVQLPRPSGAEGTRTLDPRLAKPMLSQLSYGPRWNDLEVFSGSGRTKIRTSDLVVISDAL